MAFFLAPRSAVTGALLASLCTLAAAQPTGTPSAQVQGEAGTAEMISGGSGSSSGASAGSTATNIAPIVPPLIVIAPTEVRGEATLANGCWVRLFPQPAYQGTNDLTIAGPMDVPSLHRPTGEAEGVYWKAKAESLITGPTAKVTVYENAAFRGHQVNIKPGTQEPQLRQQLKFTQSIDSLKIACDK